MTAAEFRAKVAAKLARIGRNDWVRAAVALAGYGRRLAREGAGANIGEGVEPDG